MLIYPFFHRSYRCLFFCCLAFFSQNLLAQDLQPLRLGNQNPFAQIYGLPQPEGGMLPDAGRNIFQISIDQASHFSTEQASGESIYIDGESTRLMLSWRRGFASWEAGIDIPYVRHSGGRLDSFIDRWHGWFGLPDGGRDQVPQNSFRYQYTRDGRQLIELTETVSGPGDIRLSAAWQLPASGNFESAIRGSIKLPTGESDKLLGSGGLDLSLGYWRSYQAGYFFGAGILWSESGELFQEHRKNTALHFSAGLARPLFSRWQFKLQLDGHTALYDSELPQLGESLQLGIGGSVRLAENLNLDFAVSEDIVVDSAADVNFHLRLYRRF